MGSCYEEACKQEKSLLRCSEEGGVQEPFSFCILLEDAWLAEEGERGMLSGYNETPDCFIWNETLQVLIPLARL